MKTATSSSARGRRVHPTVLPEPLPMTARTEILSHVRDRLPIATELPNLGGNWIQYPDPISQFQTVLAAVGGTAVRVSDCEAANRVLAAAPAYRDAQRMYSAVDGIGQSNLELPAASNPHQLADVDFAVLPGHVAVAENGAIWVATDDLLVRTMYFITQHLAIVVPAASIVSNLHEAYQRIDVTRHRFGTFLSGPSKTADIEQSLVIGAHGARSLTVLLLG